MDTTNYRTYFFFYLMFSYTPPLKIDYEIGGGQKTLKKRKKVSKVLFLYIYSYFKKKVYIYIKVVYRNSKVFLIVNKYDILYLDLYYIYNMDEIYKKHKYWIGLAYSFGITDFPEDAVQDAYIKIYGKENINDSFFGYVIRSVCIDMIRKKKLDTISFYDNLDVEDLEPSTTTDITDVLFTLDNWTWDEKLFYLKYIEEELSLRKFALKYHYNFTWVYRTLKELKERLKQIKH